MQTLNWTQKLIHTLYTHKHTDANTKQGPKTHSYTHISTDTNTIHRTQSIRTSLAKVFVFCNGRFTKLMLKMTNLSVTCNWVKHYTASSKEFSPTVKSDSECNYGNFDVNGFHYMFLDIVAYKLRIFVLRWLIIHWNFINGLIV